MGEISDLLGLIAKGGIIFPIFCCLIIALAKKIFFAVS
jgi:hypothetical protein